MIIVLTVAVPLAPQGSRELRAQEDHRFSSFLLKMRIAEGIEPSVDFVSKNLYFSTMQTTVDIDDAVLHAAEDRARKQGKPLSALIEEALRMTVKTDASFSATPSASADEGLEENDLFFATLEEIRALGRLPTPHREVRFH